MNRARARLHNIVKSFSLTGKSVFYVLVLAFSLSSLSLLWILNDGFMVSVPKNGGELVEGVIGMPRFVNPVLAVTEGDKDLTALIYSGLMRKLPDGKLVPDIAEKYSISEDGKVYTFNLKPKAKFSDGSQISADDVVFTITKIQDVTFKSPEYANWQGVSAEKVDDKTVRFTLASPYSPFLSNTTIGILPMKLWADASGDAFTLSNLNLEPVGSGPFKLKNIAKNSSGAPAAYVLSSNKNFPLGAPHLSKITVKFYSTEKTLLDAYKAGDIESINGISPDTAVSLEKSGGNIISSALPRVFGVFLNIDNNEAFYPNEVREALDMVVNRDYIVNTVLQGYGTVLTSPVPKNLVGKVFPTDKTASSTEEIIAKANAILDKGGWTLNDSGVREKKTKRGTTLTLAFSISTSDAPELKAVAEILKEEWSKLGASVDVKVFDTGYLNQNVIRPRKYDALLFGQIVNRDLDLYAFWHSSQIKDPGLNIAMYSNKTADKALEDLRTASTTEAQSIAYETFAKEISNDKPAIFLYAPDFIHIMPANMKGMSDGTVAVPSERFADVYNWYNNTEKVWKIFAKNN